MSNVKKLMMTAAGGGAGAFAGVLTDNSAYLRSTFGEGVAMDSEGNYYFLSRVWTGQRYTYVTKIDPVGTIIQTVRVQSSNFEGSSICIDSSDNIYVGGRGGTGGQLPMIIKWNSSFTLQWAYNYNYANSNRTLTIYRGSTTGIATDGSSVWLVGTMPVSGAGDRGYFLKAACSNGDPQYAQNFYRASSPSQHYINSVVVNSNYVYVGGFNLNEGENIVNVFNKSTSLKKGNTDAIEIGSNQTTGDAQGCELTVDSNGTVYAVANYMDTSNSNTRYAAVVELNSSANLVVDYHMYGTENTSGSFINGGIVHTENGNVAIFGDFSDDSNSKPGRKAVLMSVDDGLTSTINYADSWHLTGNYSNGSSAEINLSDNGSKQIIMSKDGSHIVGIGTYNGFNQDASNTNRDHSFIFSHPVDGVGSGGAVNAGGLQVFGNITTIQSSTQPWSSSSFSTQNLTNDTVKQDVSSTLTILTSYSMYNEIYTY